MPVTIASYSQSPPYTATEFASLLRTAFIDAGVMTDWEDTFTSGAFETRILKLIYSADTYGSTYIKFLFNGADAFVHIARNWSNANNESTGTQYLDYLSNTLTSTSNYMRLAGQNASQTLTIRRYTSQARANFTVFMIVNGTLNYTFFIERTAPTTSMVDLTKEIYHGLMAPRLVASGNTAELSFLHFPLALRGCWNGRWLRGNTSASNYGANTTASPPWNFFGGDVHSGFTYGAIGNANNASANIDFSREIIQLPIAFNNTNPAETTDRIPACSGMLMSPYSAATLPSDFAILISYASNTVQVLSTVSSGAENYEVISVANASSVGLPTIMLGARTN